MQTKKYMSLLGLARRAGKLSMGHDTALEAVRKRKAKLIVFASDISQRTVSDFEYENSNVPAVRIEETIAEIHFALGYKAGVLAVNDENFANRITELIYQEENVYGDKN